jgi:broad specificity polyphosphatase/5'/3'-nucleotidase SurE
VEAQAASVAEFGSGTVGAAISPLQPAKTPSIATSLPLKNSAATAKSIVPVQAVPAVAATEVEFEPSI